MKQSLLFWSAFVVLMILAAILAGWLFHYMRRKSTLVNACYYGNIEAAERLIELGAEVNMNSMRALKPTPLAMAAGRGHMDAARILL